jgi:hypothetical protein
MLPVSAKFPERARTDTPTEVFVQVGVCLIAVHGSMKMYAGVGLMIEK